MKITTEPDVSGIKDYLAYDPETGVFTWLKNEWHPRLKGKQAGTSNGKGYRQIFFRGASMSEHRLAWFYVYGAWPKQQIDHINQNGSDNRIANLREATQVQQRGNQGLSRVNTSGQRGVRRHRLGKKWLAQITINGKYKHLGSFPSKEEAARVYQAAAKAHWGEFAPKASCEETRA